MKIVKIVSATDLLGRVFSEMQNVQKYEQAALFEHAHKVTRAEIAASDQNKKREATTQELDFN